MTSVRDKVVANGWWGISNEPRIHYRQSRPIDGLDQPYKLDLWTDCSGFVTCCYKWAGAPDPNGENFDGDGFTGTQLGHCEHITRDQLRRADLIVSGPYSGDHVVMALEDGPNPLCVSHGTEGGPLAYRLDQLEAYHRPPYTYLRCPGIDDEPAPAPAPTPEDHDMQYGYFVQHDGAGENDPVWLASTTFDPKPVDNFDVAHVVCFLTGITILPVPAVAKQGLAARAGKKEVTWLLDAAGARYFGLPS